MPLDEPPGADRLTLLPSFQIAGEQLHRVYRFSGGDGLKRSPWWFRSRPEASTELGGRFDLPSPNGSCYLARSAVGAVLEAFQNYGHGLLPRSELAARRRLEVIAPDGPAAADLSHPAAYGVAGVTASIWGGGDAHYDLMAMLRAKTQRWAAALFEAGWRALHHGIQHDPSGQQRAITLFGHAGEHLPDQDQGWAAQALIYDLVHDQDLMADLLAFGIRVERDDVNLSIVSLDDSGLGEPGR